MTDTGESQLETARIRVSGTVQGVFYRAWTQVQAKKLAITGWAENCPDGSVDVLAQGRSESLNVFIGLLKQGPASASVRDVEVNWEQTQERFGQFKIRD